MPIFVDEVSSAPLLASVVDTSVGSASFAFDKDPVHSWPTWP